MSDPSVIVVPVLSDNYAFIVKASNAVVVIDPGEASPVLDALKKHSLKPTHILITHYEYDHIGGLNELAGAFSPRVIGPEPASAHLDKVCGVGADVVAGDLTFRVIDTPGHYVPHVSFYEERMGWLFAGDCIFGAGCGRVRGNQYAAMYQSLQKLAALPDETLVYFGHEYTLSNLAFATSVEPGNKEIQRHREHIAQTLKAGQPSSPSNIATEKRVNPFLRASSREIREILGMPDQPDADVFTALRKAKDVFSG